MFLGRINSQSLYSRLTLYSLRKQTKICFQETNKLWQDQKKHKQNSSFVN